MDAYTFEQTAERLGTYDAWAKVVTEDGGRSLYEGPDADSARPLTAPRPEENLKTHVPGRYSVHQLYDAYRIAKLLAELVRGGSHLYSKGPKENALRPEPQLEYLVKKLERSR